MPGPADNVCITAGGTYTVTMTQTGGSGPVTVSSLTIGGASGTQTLALGVCSSEDVGTLTVGEGISNGSHGAIVLSGEGEGCGAPGSFTLQTQIANAGRLAVEPVAHGAVRALRGNLANSGTLEIEASTAFDGAGTRLANEGAIDLRGESELTVSAGEAVGNLRGGSIMATGSGALLLSEATFNEGAGSTSGSRPVVVDDGTLDYTGAPAAHGAGPVVLRGTSTLLGEPVRTNQTLAIEGTCSENALVQDEASLVNNGTIELTGSGACEADATLDLKGARLENDSSLKVEQPLKGTRTIAGSLENNAWLKLFEGSTLEITGNYTQTAGGTLSTGIAGPSEFGKLAVAGTATLTGKLDTARAPSFKPSAGQTFRDPDGRVPIGAVRRTGRSPGRQQLPVFPADLLLHGRDPAPQGSRAVLLGERGTTRILGDRERQRLPRRRIHRAHTRRAQRQADVPDERAHELQWRILGEGDDSASGRPWHRLDRGEGRQHGLSRQSRLHGHIDRPRWRCPAAVPPAAVPRRIGASLRQHWRRLEPAVMIPGVTLLAVKLLLAPAFVVGASLTARRHGPRVGGLVGALPVVAGPILLVYALAHGRAFAAHAAAGTLLGLISLTAFVVVYARLAGRVRWL